MAATVYDIQAALAHYYPHNQFNTGTVTDTLLRRMEEQQCLIVTGRTGCGKTTTVPPVAHLLGLLRGTAGRVTMTLPKRLIADKAAEKLAKDLGVVGDGIVGVTYKGYSTATQQTAIHLQTDGYLAVRLQHGGDSFFNGSHTVIVDEAHERSISTDALLMYLKRLMVINRELRVIIMSATSETARLMAYFGVGSGAIHEIIAPAPQVREIFYAEAPVPKYTETAARLAVDCLTVNNNGGDILIFVPGRKEIKATTVELAFFLNRAALPMRPDVCSLFAEQAEWDRRRALASAPDGRCKIIVATNVAESSITLPHVTVVIDSGLSRFKYFDPTTGVESLLVSAISKSSADQRAGRCGRTRAGRVFRLYTKQQYERLADHAPPAIASTDVSSFVLSVFTAGLVMGDALQRPSDQSLAAALPILFRLTLVDVRGRRIGRSPDLFSLPLPLPLSAMLLGSTYYGCVDNVIDMVALLSTSHGIHDREEDAREQVKEGVVRFWTPWGYPLTAVNILAAARCAMVDRGVWLRTWAETNGVSVVNLEKALQIANDLRVRVAQLLGHPRDLPRLDPKAPSYPRAMIKAFLWGTFENLAERSSPGKYTPLDGRPGSSTWTLPNEEYLESEPALVSCLSVELSSNTALTFMKNVVPVTPQLVRDVIDDLRARRDQRQ